MRKQLEGRKTVVDYLTYAYSPEEMLDELRVKMNDALDGLEVDSEVDSSTKKLKKQSKRYNDYNYTRLFFRGQSNCNYGLQSSAYRNDNQKKEDFFYHEMLVRCPDEFKNTTNFEKLAIMQHHGCPTRLLDITSNPLVALYFACKDSTSDKENPEGKVYIFRVDSRQMVYADSSRALILSCLAKFGTKDKQEILKIVMENIGKENLPINVGDSLYKHNVIEKLHYEITKEIPSFQRKIKPLDLLKPLYIQPNKINNRILKQDGAFIISGLCSDGYEEQLKLEFLSYVRLRIRNKKKLLEQLNQLGIDEATLFPDMDHVAQYLKSLEVD